MARSAMEQGDVTAWDHFLATLPGLLSSMQQTRFLEHAFSSGALEQMEGKARENRPSVDVAKELGRVIEGLPEGRLRQAWERALDWFNRYGRGAHSR